MNFENDPDPNCEVIGLDSITIGHLVSVSSPLLCLLSPRVAVTSDLTPGDVW